MKKSLSIIFAITCIALSQGEGFQPFVGYTAKQHAIQTELTQNKNYLLYIHLPSSYESTTDKTYPVLYVLDPYWDFVSVTNMLGTLEYDKYLPEVIVIGIGYPGENPDYGKLRQLDYTPTESELKQGTGGAKAFLTFIEQEVIPWTESTFRVDDSFRALSGSSYGGLFTLFAMLEKPDLFQGHISSTPAVSFDNRALFQLENKFYIGKRELLFASKPDRDLPTRLFMSVGAQENGANWVHEANAFASLLENRNYSNFTFEYEVFEGHKHGGVKFPTYSRGLSYIFEDYMARQED